jgi:hypothetical protein
MAAFAALKAAHDGRAGWYIRELGTRAGPPLTIYPSAPTHDVNARAADMLGLGAKRCVGSRATARFACAPMRCARRSRATRGTGSSRSPSSRAPAPRPPAPSA